MNKKLKNGCATNTQHKERTMDTLMNQLVRESEPPKHDNIIVTKVNKNIVNKNDDIITNFRISSKFLVAQYQLPQKK